MFHRRLFAAPSRAPLAAVANAASRSLRDPVAAPTRATAAEAAASLKQFRSEQLHEHDHEGVLKPLQSVFFSGAEPATTEQPAAEKPLKLHTLDGEHNTTTTEARPHGLLGKHDLPSNPTAYTMAPKSEQHDETRYRTGTLIASNPFAALTVIVGVATAGVVVSVLCAEPEPKAGEATQYAAVRDNDLEVATEKRKRDRGERENA
jgi:hypothetical protein